MDQNRNFNRTLSKALALTLLMALATTVRAGDGDWQQWSQISYLQKLDYSLETSLRFEPRLDDDFSRFYYYELEPMLNWRYSPRWDFAVSYERDEFLEQRTEDEPETKIDNLATLGATLKIPLKDWKISNLFRAEWVVPQTGDEDWSTNYRNRTEVKTTWRWGSKELEPYLFEEWFYNFQEGEFIQNRAGVGIGVPIVEHWMAKVYFMRFDERTMNGWEWHPVLGIQVDAQF
ncbi:MAG: DUF2490 domain-containing protein [Verrucomicrobiales bacterium]|nr:DUF2490 domain-containing protein [Verrucomicrobiales bacterium]